MHLLITRPIDEAQALQAHLAARSVAATIAPMLEIELLPPIALELDGVQALIATSRNAIKALSLSPERAQAVALPVYVVGTGTAELAADIGFQLITVGPGSAKDLASVIMAHATPGGGGLLQLGGDKLAFNLAQALAPHGFAVQVCTVYRSRPAERFPDEALRGLQAGTIDTVLLTSPLAARTFVGLAMRENLHQRCRGLVYICLSNNIAHEIAALDPAAVHVAAAPNTGATLALIESLIASPAVREH